MKGIAPNNNNEVIEVESEKIISLIMVSLLILINWI